MSEAIDGIVEIPGKGKFPLASPHSRIGARAIDYSISASIGWGLVSWFSGDHGFDLKNNPNPEAMIDFGFSGWEMVAIFCLFLIPELLFNIVNKIFSRFNIYGVSVGKWLVGIQVVRVSDGTQLGFVANFRRAVMIPAFLLASSFVGNELGIDGDLRFAAFSIFAVPLLPILATRYRQGWHDMAAGTVVIKERKSIVRHFTNWSLGKNEQD